MARVRSVASTTSRPLEQGWTCAALAAGRVEHPTELDAAGAHWVPAVVPGTAALAMQLAGAWSLDEPRAFDADDWWFRCRLPPVAGEPGVLTVLRFGGLASIADAWVDGEHVLRSQSMFAEHEVPVPAGRGEADLVLRFGSLEAALKVRRPRPRWRATIVTQQNLRWFRTALLGRVPWTPPVTPVGPYAPVSLETHRHLHVRSADVMPRLDGRAGVCRVRVRLHPLGGASVRSASLVVGGERAVMSVEFAADAIVLEGEVRLADVAPWWPFTHGEPSLYRVQVVASTTMGDVAIGLGKTGFRDLRVDRDGGAFSLRVNGVEIFCRGACWTPLDVVGLRSDPGALRADLEAARAAGMNMLRASGAMTYPPHEFHDLCDELGILVWQDFMFANMDYPTSDESFAAMASAEVRDSMDRLQASPSLAVVCGNSEVEQQAAMLGLPPEAWSSSFFGAVVPALVAAARPDVVYVPSSPTGGALPFRLDAGVSHYYGVGGYRRPLSDARRSRVRFTSECLGFANVPSDDLIDSFMGGATPPQHPRWKQRVPRDNGTPWDFDDVRDHYVREIFGVDPAELRMQDVSRYLELGRLATGEAMAAAMSEWRRVGSTCRGAIVWTYRDFWPGAGWGVCDARGKPKAAYYFLKRVLQPVTLLATDEGLDGLSLHVVNDLPRAFEGEVRLVLYRHGQVPVCEGTVPVTVGPHRGVEILSDAVLGRFTDVTYAYRFAAPGHDLVVATLRDRATGTRVAQAFHFPCGRPSLREPELGLEARAERVEAGRWRVTVRSRRFAEAVAIEAEGLVPGDDFFHVEPGGEHSVMLTGAESARPARVKALNSTGPTPILHQA